jgi:DHA2 family multidrug resistance protein-like MFS transporter
MVPIVYAIKEFAVHGAETALPLVLVVAGLVFGVLFVRRQNRLATPMLDMALFRRWSFSGSVLVNLLSVIGLVGFLYFVAQHLQLIVGLSPLEAGLALVPGLLAMIVAGIGIVPIAKRVAPRIVVPVALSFSILGYLLVAISTSAGALALLIAAFVALGIGIGAAETVSNELILASAPPSKAGAASAVSETAYELGAVLGTTIIGGLLAAFYRASLALPAGLTDDVAHASRETLAGAVAASHTLDEPLGQALRDAAAHAFDAGVGVTSLIGAGLIVVAAVIAALTLGGRAKREHVEH